MWVILVAWNNPPYKPIPLSNEVKYKLVKANKDE